MYIGATAGKNQLVNACELVGEYHVIGLKMFAGKSTGSLAILDEESQRKTYQILTDAGFNGVLAVHCEKEALMTERFDPKNPYTHAIARPAEAETASVRDQIMFAEDVGFKGTLHIAHVSCKGSLTLIDEARLRNKIKITCGVTPHHAMWTDDKLKGDHGLLYKTNPPLRGVADVKYLCECIKAGKIDWIETDHAPHTLGEKLHCGHPSGYPSMYIYKEFVEQFLPGIGVSREIINNMTSTNIANIFKFNKNTN
jgi:dihydroorotase